MLINKSFDEAIAKKEEEIKVLRVDLNNIRNSNLANSTKVKLIKTFEEDLSDCQAKIASLNDRTFCTQCEQVVLTEIMEDEMCIPCYMKG